MFSLRAKWRMERGWGYLGARDNEQQPCVELFSVRAVPYAAWCRKLVGTRLLRRRAQTSTRTPTSAERAGVWLSTVALAAMMVACTSATQPESSVTPVAVADYIDLLDNSLEQAALEGASDQQIALLESTRELGYLPYDKALEALLNYGECAEDNGLEFEVGVPSGPPMMPQLQYTTTVPHGMGESVMDMCDLTHFSRINSTYQLQPQMAQLRLEYALSKADLLRECVIEAGRPLEANATIDEIRDEVFFVWQGSYFGEVPDYDAISQPVDCAGAAGLDLNDLAF